jgi:hypothetical protein
VGPCLQVAAGADSLQMWRVAMNILVLYNVKWVPVTMAWRVLRSRMEETASRYGR